MLEPSPKRQGGGLQRASSASRLRWRRRLNATANDLLLTAGVLRPPRAPPRAGVRRVVRRADQHRHGQRSCCARSSRVRGECEGRGQGVRGYRRAASAAWRGVGESGVMHVRLAGTEHLRAERSGAVTYIACPCAAARAPVAASHVEAKGRCRGGVVEARTSSASSSGSSTSGEPAQAKNGRCSRAPLAFEGRRRARGAACRRARPGATAVVLVAGEAAGHAGRRAGRGGRGGTIPTSRRRGAVVWKRSAASSSRVDDRRRRRTAPFASVSEPSPRLALDRGCRSRAARGRPRRKRVALIARLIGFVYVLADDALPASARSGILVARPQTKGVLRAIVQGSVL